jgi:mitogen-activated protein kinase kinase kinase
MHIARSLSDEELIAICKSPHRPERERLILRKKHLPMSHDEFHRKRTIKQKFRKLENFFGEKPPPSRLRNFFGQRPPSELISSNLAEYFPGHRKDMLETVNSVRNSMIRNSMARSTRASIFSVGGLSITGTINEEADEKGEVIVEPEVVDEEIGWFGTFEAALID